MVSLKISGRGRVGRMEVLHLHVRCVWLGGNGYSGKWGRRAAVRELLCMPDSDGGSCCKLSCAVAMTIVLCLVGG